MKKIIILVLTVALSFYPSVTSLAADETTEIQESLPIPNPGPPTPEPRIDPPTPPEPPMPVPDPPTLPEPTLKDPGSAPANDNFEDDTWNNYLETLKILDSRFQTIINNQETIRRNQLETQKVIRILTLIVILTPIVILTNLWLAIGLILVPIFKSFQSEQDNANQEETHLNNPVPSFDPDMMDK